MKEFLNNPDNAQMLVVVLFVLALWLLPTLIVAIFIAATVWLIIKIIYTLLND